MPQVSCPYSACFECDLQHIGCQAPPGRGSRSARTELSRKEGGWLLTVYLSRRAELQSLPPRPPDHSWCLSSNQNHRIPYGGTTNFAVTLPSTPADQGEQRRTVTNAYSQVAGMHEQVRT